MADPPLDEVQWRSALTIQQIGGIHTNTVLPYFAASPFFDQTSNNATLTNQALYNPNMFHFIQTREAFEGRLRSMAGLEFMVIHEPSDTGRQSENSGVWVIRKQIRRKRQDQEDEITPLSSYFIVGENVYMAPSMGNVIGSRMLSTVQALTSMFTTASSLGAFTPSLGHTYPAPASKPFSSSATSSFQLTQTSKASTPALESQSQNGTSRTKSSLATVSDPRGVHLLAESFSLALRYGDEYMDETAIVGEPGAFIIQKSREEKSSVKPVSSMASSKPATPIPPPIQTSFTAEEVAKKGIKGAEKSPLTPGTSKRRKKSRVLTNTTTPK